MPQSITVLSWMKNEADILPFFLRHYAFADRIIVWDNKSTDATRSILEFNPKVEVRDWITDGAMDDFALMRMKNEEYRNTGPGWKIVVDADEFVWHPDITGLLNGYEKAGVTLPGVKGRDMVSKEMPQDDGKSLLTDWVKEGVPNPWYSKFCVFRDCVLVEYCGGVHKLKSVGGVVVKAQRADLLLLHFRYLSLERTVRKAREYKLSDANREAGIGLENCNVPLMEERWRQAYANRTRIIP